MSSHVATPRAIRADFGVLREVESRVLWLSSAMIHHANRLRPIASGLKVGGHQASSASMVSTMTVLWFRHLQPQDPDPVDYSTGSVGIGATAPIWGALSRRYVCATIGDVGGGSRCCARSSQGRTRCCAPTAPESPLPRRAW